MKPLRDLVDAMSITPALQTSDHNLDYYASALPSLHPSTTCNLQPFDEQDHGCFRFCSWAHLHTGAWRQALAGYLLAAVAACMLACGFLAGLLGIDAACKKGAMSKENMS